MINGSQVAWRRTADRVLPRVLTDPGALAQLQLSEWDRLLPQARSAGLLARLEVMLNELGLLEQIPEPIKPHLVAARHVAKNEQNVIRWEINRLAHALSGLDTRVVLLKGAAYVAQGLPVAKGRTSSDVDILVGKNALETIERALLTHGWQHIKLDDYDQYFYRHWSHELPPLQHRDRGTVADVHHTILPPTGRLRPDPEKLMAASVPVQGTRFHVLAPADMVLHSAAHAFQDGDLQRAWRDLVDLDGLIRHFAHEKAFWSTLTARAEELKLSAPLQYGLRYAQKYLQTPVPDSSREACGNGGCLWLKCSVMDKLVEGAVELGGRTGRSPRSRVSLWLLYIRAHWLRMPPQLLSKHLLLKARRRWRAT